MKTDPEKARAWRRRSKRLKPASNKRLAQRDEHAEIRETVFARDGRRCLMANRTCRGGLTVHHLLKAAQGGKYEPENLVTLCAGCNSWVEDWPDTAHAMGLVVRRGETIDDAWTRLRRTGLVPR